MFELGSRGVLRVKGCCHGIIRRKRSLACARPESGPCRHRVSHPPRFGLCLLRSMSCCANGEVYSGEREWIDIRDESLGLRLVVMILKSHGVVQQLSLG